MYDLEMSKPIKPENWTSFDVFNWIAETAILNELSFHTFNAKKYNYLNGKSLKKMTLEAFWDLTQCRNGGLKMFKAKQNLFVHKVGRPRKKPLGDQEVKEKPYGKVWEFIGKLLANEDTCPSLIKWDNYEAASFKFVQPKKVAELWGLRKENTKMDYNKFTRALRYHYKKGFLIPVGEKRLVYKFGPKAIEIRNKFKNNSVPPKPKIY